MGKFDPVKLKKAFNRAVDAHKANGGNPTQIRPKIKSIVKNKRQPEPEMVLWAVTYTGRDYAPVTDEAAIAGLVHSYTAQVAQLTGDVSLIEDSYFKEV